MRRAEDRPVVLSHAACGALKMLVEEDRRYANHAPGMVVDRRSPLDREVERELADAGMIVLQVVGPARLVGLTQAGRRVAGLLYVSILDDKEVNG